MTSSGREVPAASSVIGIAPQFDAVPIDALLKLLESFFPKAFGINPEDLPPIGDTIDEILTAMDGKLSGVMNQTTVERLLKAYAGLKGLFTEGLDWIVGKIMD